MKERKKVKLSDDISNKLEQIIITTMKAGDRLPTEKELEDQFGVGRSTIRESMKVLSAKGLIIRKNEGTFVSDGVKDCLIEPLNLLINMDVGPIENLLQLRECLELDVIRLAIGRFSDEDFQNIERIIWKMQNPDITKEQSTELDVEIHCAFAKATGNIVLMELLNAVHRVIIKNLGHMPNVKLKSENAIASHKKLIEAFKENNLEKALNVMDEHLSIFNYREQ